MHHLQKGNIMSADKCPNCGVTPFQYECCGRVAVCHVCNTRFATTAEKIF